MIIVKALMDISTDIKANDYIIANNGVMFFEINNHQVSIISTGNFAYDLKGESYKKISESEANSLVAGVNDPVNQLKELEDKVKQLEAENKTLTEKTEKVETANKSVEDNKKSK